MGVVVFSASAFKTRYPEFSTVGDTVLDAYFSESTIYLNNTESSRVQDVGQRGVLLNMLTAHLAALYSGVSGRPPVGVVGRINSATEGSVTVAADMGPVTNSQAWYLQTKYGAQYWAATAQYRQMVYRPGYSQSAPPSYDPITGRYV